MHGICQTNFSKPHQISKLLKHTKYNYSLYYMVHMNLPPGLKFDPTDEELVLHFLYPKLANSLPSTSHAHLIPELDFYHSCIDPWQLEDHGAAFESYGQRYFYTKTTENRVTKSGYWIEVDVEQPIFDRTYSNRLMGFKKYLVFYMGEFPSGVRTGWLMQEYHLCNNVFRGKLGHKTRRKQPDVNKWVLCRVQEVCDNSHLASSCHEGRQSSSNEVELSSLDEVFLSLEDDHDEISCPN